MINEIKKQKRKKKEEKVMCDLQVKKKEKER